eukprot:scaffold134281_cov32-Tisochrysis_lutea.AAC.4
MAPDTLYVGLSPAAAQSDACTSLDCSAGRIERTSSSCSASRRSGLKPVIMSLTGARVRAGVHACGRATSAQPGSASSASMPGDIAQRGGERRTKHA